MEAMLPTLLAAKKKTGLKASRPGSPFPNTDMPTILGASKREITSPSEIGRGERSECGDINSTN